MSTTKNFITLDEIIARYDEVGNVFEVDTERAVDLRTKNSKSIFDVTYMPLQFKLTSGFHTASNATPSRESAHINALR